MKTMPFSRHQSATFFSQPAGGTMNPPSPWMGSMMTAATFCSPICACTALVNASKASSVIVSGLPTQRYGYAIGMR